MNGRTYLICHRLFTFFDEWFFYGTLVSLYALHKYEGWPLWMFAVAGIWGALVILISYYRQWKMEAEILGDLKNDPDENIVE